MQRKTEYVYVGDRIPKINFEQHSEFILIYQKSILLSLVERKLLTIEQYERCVEELEYRSIYKKECLNE